MPLTQKSPAWQSRSRRHALPPPQGRHVPPPQSMSVSSPFLMPSVQVGAADWQIPALHVDPLGQTLPHAPQFDASVASVTHAPLQAVCPAGQGEQTEFTQLPLVQSPPVAQVLPSSHVGQVPPQSMSDSLPFLTPSWQVGWHCPPVHGWSATQVVAQSPQCCVSVLVSTHTPLQLVYPFWQVNPHWPLAQVAVACAGGVQTWLHPPQFTTSSARCRQTPLQLVYPVLQEIPQTPLVHVAVPFAGAGQLWPHDPQFDVLVAVLTHAPLQSVCPLGQEQTPFWQTEPAGQAAPQAPQFPGSDRISVQVRPHSFGALAGQQSGGTGFGGFGGFPASASPAPAAIAAPLSAPPTNARMVSRRVRRDDIHFVTRSNWLSSILVPPSAVHRKTQRRLTADLPARQVHST